jgi:hypothetical protein
MKVPCPILKTVRPDDHLDKFFVTYGNGSNLKDCYSIVEAKDMKEAREKIHEEIGQDFSFCYEIRFLKAQISNYGLQEVPLQRHVMKSR